MEVSNYTYITFSNYFPNYKAKRVLDVNSYSNYEDCLSLWSFMFFTQKNKTTSKLL